MALTDLPRWQYRFQNFQHAYRLLQEAIDISKNRELSSLEQVGVIQRFEYTWELAWKTLKDYLEYTGIVLETITPTHVIRSAFQAKIIQQAEIWLAALDTRNKMAHTYDEKKFEQAIVNIQQSYICLLKDLATTLNAVKNER